MISTQLINRIPVAIIADSIDRHPSTVYREIKRNAFNEFSQYHAEPADLRARTRRSHSRRGSTFSTQQWRRVTCKLKRQWSPEQISGTLKGSLNISHQTIYAYVHHDKLHGGLLYKNLRIVSKAWRKRRGSPSTRGVAPNKKHISTRPKSVETRKTVGHWEGDTVIGIDKYACILTMVERKSGLVRIRKLKRRTTEETTPQLIAMLTRECAKAKSVTFDNGSEFHDFQSVENYTRVPCYFATPYHSWERGTNENTNGLIRQYIPKGQCMTTLTQKHCDSIAYSLNTRPRKRHGYKTPLEIYNA
jgi:transposase, IS30 family